MYHIASQFGSLGGNVAEDFDVDVDSHLRVFNTCCWTKLTWVKFKEQKKYKSGDW